VSDAASPAPAPAPPDHHKARLAALRALAVFEAFKGLVVILAGVGLLRFERGIQRIASITITHLHLNPARNFSRIFTYLDNAPSHIRWLAVGAAAYAIGRFVEAAGLWYDKKWAIWVAVWTAVIYIPFEVRNLVGREPHPVALVALIVNSAIVLYLLSSPEIKRQNQG
jgi:uncharacterized membrane protein (DUF2068 family)